MTSGNERITNEEKKHNVDTCNEHRNQQERENKQRRSRQLMSIFTFEEVSNGDDAWGPANNEWHRMTKTTSAYEQCIQQHWNVDSLGTLVAGTLLTLRTTAAIRGSFTWCSVQNLANEHGFRIEET